MASPTRTLTVNIVGRTDSVDKAFKRVSKGSSLMSDRLAKGLKMGGLAFAALGGAAIAAARTLGPMIQKAADIEESLSKNKVLFGEASVAVEKWSERTTKSLGISRREALEAVGNFGALTHAMGMSGEEGSKMSMQLVDLAADMASFNNASPEETLTAIAAGLRGENEPLRRFGVLLDAATLKTKALEKGLISSTKDALTPQTKALAAYSEILGQTEVQQGDFQRTSDGLANQQKLLAATWDDLQASIGEKLRPALTAFVSFLNDNVMPAIDRFANDPSVKNAGLGMGEVLFGAIGEGMNREQQAQEGNWWDFIFETPGLDAIKTGKEFYDSVKEGFDRAQREANLLAEVERIMDEKAVIFGQDFADAWQAAFNQRMQGFDFNIPDAEDISNEIFNPEGMAAAEAAAEEFYEAMGFQPPGAPGGADPLNETASGMPIIPDVGGITDEMFNPALTIDPLETATGMPIIPDLDPATNMPPVFTQEELDYFDKAVAAGFFGSQGGPGKRGEDLTMAGLKTHAAGMMGTNTVTVNINAPAVTPDEVQTAIVKGFTDNSVGLSDLYFI